VEPRKRHQNRVSGTGGGGGCQPLGKGRGGAAWCPTGQKRANLTGGRVGEGGGSRVGAGGGFNNRVPQPDLQEVPGKVLVFPPVSAPPTECTG